MKSKLVKIIRNYNSENEEIQDDVKAVIQSDISFFDLDVDIKRLDYVIIPNRDEPLVVEKVRAYNSRPPGHKEVILIPELEFLQKYGRSKKNLIQGFENEAVDICKDFTINNFTVNVYLKALEKAVEKSNIPKSDKNNLIKKIKEIEDNPYIESLNTTVVVEVKQIVFN